MGYYYFALDEPEKGLDAYRRAVSARPDYAQALDSLAEGYLKVGRLDEAVATYNKAIQADPDYYPSMPSLSYVHALKEEYPQALRWTDEFFGKSAPRHKSRNYLLKAFYLFLSGRTEDSLSNIQMAADLAENLDHRVDRADADWLRAWIHYDRGDFELAQRSNDDFNSALVKADPSVGPFNEIGPLFFNGLIALGQKQSGRLTTCLKEMESLSSDSSIMNSKYSLERTRFEREWLRAMAALQGISPNEYSDALNDAEAAVRIPDSGYIDVVPWIRYNTPFQRDAIARNYAERGDTDKAIAQYVRLITFDPKSPSRVLINPLYHYRLAKLYDQKGLKDKAKAQFERFLELWKDADPGQHEVEDAKARLKALF